MMRSQKCRQEFIIQSKQLNEFYLMGVFKPIIDEPNFFFIEIFGQFNNYPMKVKIKLEKELFENETEVFRLIEIQNTKFKKKVTFLIYSYKRIILLTFQSKKKNLTFSKVLYKNVESQIGISFCQFNKFLIVPNKKRIEFWDKTMTHEIHSINIENKILGYHLIPQDNSLIIYDKYR